MVVGGNTESNINAIAEGVIVSILNVSVLLCISFLQLRYNKYSSILFYIGLQMFRNVLSGLGMSANITLWIAH